MPRDFTSRSCLRLTVEIQLAFHPSDPFLINNQNMTGNSVEKLCCVQGKITSKT